MNLNLSKLLKSENSLFSISVKLLNVWYFLTFAPLIFHFNQIFGSERLLVESQLSLEWYHFGSLIMKADSILLNWVLLLCSLLLALLSFFRPQKVSYLIGLYFLHLNLGLFIYPSQTSGWNIINNIYLFIIFSFFLAKWSDDKFIEDSFLTPLFRWQVVILYTQNGYLKSTGNEWFFGKALQYVLYNKDFANFSYVYDVVPLAMLKVLSGCVLIFFLTFWISMFFKRLNKVYVYIGMFLHSYLF